jgi:membrane protein YdbS with pleckstrin-like domain
MARGDPSFSVRPVFIGWITLLVQLPVQLFFTIWASGFLGGISSSSGLFERGSETPFVFFGALAFFGVPTVAYMGKKLNYSRTEYRFLADHLEFEEGFFSINKKVIRYRDVREVTLHKGFLQRIYDLGTIYIATLATGSTPGFRPFTALGFGNISASGISVRDVRDPDRVFEQIRRIIDAHRE